MILRSRQLICSSRETIDNGAVAIQDGIIEAIGRFSDVKRSCPGRITDLGDDLICPGLINAHAHLQFSALRGALNDFSCFTDWLLRLVAATRSWSRDQYADSAMAGLTASLTGGTTSLVEVTGTDGGIDAVRRGRLRRHILFEVIGFDTTQEDSCRAILADRMARVAEEPLLQVGLAPHAPYTVSASLLRYCKSEADRLGRLFSIHLSETEEEIQFVQDGTGPIRDFKEQIGLPANGWAGAGCTPVGYLRELNLIDRRTLLVHCNYLTDDDIRLIADSGATVVYCPMSHTYFRHENYPLDRLLAAGIPVALGTDSLASNESLSILDQMKHLHANWPDFPADQIVQMGTEAAAPALGQEGRLREGGPADLVAIRCGEGVTPYESMIGDGSEVMMNMVDGRILFDRHAGERRQD